MIRGITTVANFKDRKKAAGQMDTVHVVPLDNEEWGIVLSGRDDPVQRFSTLLEAVREARRRCDEEKLELVVFDRYGKIRHMGCDDDVHDKVRRYSA